MKDFLTGLLQTFGLAWWVEISTDSPRCTYFFGPFLSESEAERHKPGYVEDLQAEGAQNIRIAIKRCKPDELTLYDDTLDRMAISGVFSRQT